MPWTLRDVERFNPDLPDQYRAQWVAVANSALQSCLDDGGTTETCDAQAIMMANGVVARAQEGTMEMGDVARLTLADGSKRTLFEVCALASEAVTLKATARGLLRQLQAVLDLRDVPSRLRDEIVDVVTALRATWDDLGLEAEGDMTTNAQEQATKLIDGVEYPPSAFLVVEDPESPATWHLQVRDADGNPDHRLMGAAWAALTVGYRGNRYEGPGKEEAMRKLQALYSGEDMPEPTEVDVRIDDALDKMGEVLRALFHPVEEPVSELAESAISAETGSVVRLLEQEDGAAERDPEGPLRMRIVVIEPGLGNERDNHLYEAEMLRRDAHVFEGAKMYVTDHKETEKSVRTEVGDIAKSPVGFTDTGGVIAEARIWDPAFAKMVRNRHALGALNTLHDSIKATGKVKRGADWNGRKVNKVEQIVAAESVDWVTQAGAGGRALALMESKTGAGGNAMTDKDETIVEEVEEVVETTLNETEQAPEAMGLGETLKVLLESGLPQVAQARIAERAPFESQTQLEAAIAGEKAYIAELAEAAPRREPRVFGNSGRAPRREEQPEQSEIAEAAADELDKIIAAHLGR